MQLFVYELGIGTFFERGIGRGIWGIGSRGGIKVSAVMLVVGEGLLADHMCEELSSQYMVFRQTDFGAIVPESIDLALVLARCLESLCSSKSRRDVSTNQHSLAARLCLRLERGLSVLLFSQVRKDALNVLICDVL